MEEAGDERNELKIKMTWKYHIVFLLFGFPLKDVDIKRP